MFYTEQYVMVGCVYNRKMLISFIYTFGILFSVGECFSVKTVVTTNRHCVLSISTEKPHQKMRNMVHNGLEVILVEFEIEQTNISSSALVPDTLYPFVWMITSAKHDRLLDTIQYNAGILSLWLLSFGVDKTKVFLRELPKGCIHSLEPTEVRKMIAVLLLNRYETTFQESLELYPDTNYEVCEKYIQEKEHGAIVRYRCCHVEQNLHINCIEVPIGKSQNTFYCVIVVLKILIFLNIAKCATKIIYGHKREYKKYLYKLNTPIEIEVTTRRSDPPGLPRIPIVQLGNETKSLNYKSELKCQSNFSKLSNQVEDTRSSGPQFFKLHAIWFKVDSERLANKQNDWIYLVRFWTRLFINSCSLFTNKENISGENMSNIYSDINHDDKMLCCVNRTTVMFHIRRMLILLLICILPVSVFLIQTWYIERKQMYENHAALRLNLSYNIPTHKFLFISYCSLKGFDIFYAFCYFLWFSPLVLYMVQLIVPNPTFGNASEKIFTLNFRSLISSSDVGWRWTLSKILASIEHTHFANLSIFHAVFKILSLVFASVLIFIVLVFHTFPTLNIFFRLISNFALEIYRTVNTHETVLFPNASWVNFGGNSAHDCFEFILRKLLNVSDKSEKFKQLSQEYPDILFRNKADRIIWSLINFTWIVYILFALPIIVDLVFLVVEIILFALVGIIIHISHTAIYAISIIFLIQYSRLVFKPLKDQFLLFNESIQKYLCHHYAHASFEEVVENADDSACNIAYQFISKSGCLQCTGCHEFVMKNGIPTWKSRQIIQFKDINKRIFIPRKFILECFKMKKFFTSRVILRNFFSASKTLAIFAMYLFFILLVLKASQEHFNPSFLNELVVMFLLGVLPIYFRSVVIPTYEDCHLNIADKRFVDCFDDIIKHFGQDWPILDLEVSLISTDKPLSQIDTKICNSSVKRKESECWVKMENGTFVCFEITGNDMEMRSAQSKVKAPTTATEENDDPATCTGHLTDPNSSIYDMEDQN